MGLFGSIGKALFGGSKKDASSKSEGTTKYDPYAPTIGPINDYLKSAGALYNGGAPQFSPTEMHGYDMLHQVTNDPNGGSVPSAIAENNKTLHGDYLDPNTNPYLKGIADRAGQAAGAHADASFGSAGREGSGLAGYYSGKGVADAVGGIYGGAYDNERNRMGAAVGQAPGLEAGRYLGPQAEISAGQNISARPFDISNQYGGVLAQIAGLGQQGSTTGREQGYRHTDGLVGKIANSFANKLFPGG